VNVQWTSASSPAPPAGLYPQGWEPESAVVEAVAAILQAVRTRGDDALVSYTRRFDCPSFSSDALRVAVPPLEELRRVLPDRVTQALTAAHDRVSRFHRRQMPADVEYREDDGTAYGYRFVPLASVGAYVPGGSAVLPSSVIMNVVPAKIAGVPRVAVFTPPQDDGSISPAILFACALCGVDEVYAAGGAQAVGAAAFGTQRIARVDKIVGPGNAWVTEAKHQVYGVCAIDGLAGPSEVLVVADGAADAHAVVNELLAQAEHDARARIAVVSQSRSLLISCEELLSGIDAATLERGGIVQAVFESGAFLIHAGSRDEVFAVVERFAPEHLALHVLEPERYLPEIRNAGAVFVGKSTPVACGDYLAGTNHVLPTSGAARFSSGLRTADFLRSYSVLQNSRERLRGDAPLIAALAEFEGLPGHARSVLDAVT
jgi:histidinol dehydrogenase